MINPERGRAALSLAVLLGAASLINRGIPPAMAEEPTQTAIYTPTQIVRPQVIVVSPPDYSSRTDLASAVETRIAELKIIQTAVAGVNFPADYPMPTQTPDLQATREAIATETAASYIEPPIYQLNNWHFDFGSGIIGGAVMLLALAVRKGRERIRR